MMWLVILTCLSLALFLLFGVANVFYYKGRYDEYYKLNEDAGLFTRLFRG